MKEIIFDSKFNIRNEKIKFIKSITMFATSIMFLTVLSNISYAATYNIASPADFTNFANQVNGGKTYAGDTVNLTANINLNGSASNSTPIIGPSSSYCFEGTFNGNNHTISGIYINANSYMYTYVGLFGYTTSSTTIKNLTVSGTVTCTADANGIGGLVSRNYGTLDNCISNLNITANDDFVGGLVAGNYDTGKITNCHHSGNVSGYTTVGGLIGINSGTVSGCTNSGSVISTRTTVRTSTDLGGLIGCNSGKGTIINSSNSAKVEGQGTNSCNIGGIIGYNENGDNSFTLFNCNNTGSISGSYGYIGGLMGDGGSCTVTNCYNKGSVSNTGNQDHLGGLIGYLRKGDITSCFNEGTVSGTTSRYCGGIVGYSYSGKISYCYNKGDINLSSNSSTGISTGGIAGGILGAITYCYNIGNISITQSGAGGIVGEIQSTASSVEYCYNAGTVKSTNGSAGGITPTISYGQIKDSYNTGSVIGNSSISSVGGLVGDTYGTANFTIINSYSCGSITNNASGSSKGGIIGHTNASITITNCYWLQGTADKACASGTVSTTSTSVKSSNDLKAIATVNLLNASRNPGPWTRKDSVNNGYPVLGYFYPIETPTLTTNPTSLSIVYGSTGSFTYTYNGDGAISVTSSSTAICTVSLDTTNKKVTITTVAVGSTTVVISAPETSKYEAISKTVSVSVTKKPITRPTASDKTYNRAAQSGVSTGEGYSLGGTTSATDVGTYTTTVTLNGNYKWSTGTETEVLSLSWKINAKTITDSMISLSYTTTTYTGSALQPTVTVKDGTATLTNPKEYTVAYTNNTNVGTSATVTVTGQGNYTGKPTKTFEITRKPIAVPTAVTGLVYNRESQTGVVGGTGYTLTGNTGTNAGSYQATATLDGNYQWNTSSNQTAAQTIQWSIAKKSISDNDVTKSIGNVTKTYNGSEQTQTITLIHAKTTLTINTEYTVTYTSNTDAGEATITIAGQGNYSGTVTSTFIIDKAENTLIVAGVPNLRYIEAPQTLVTASNPQGDVYYLLGDTPLNSSNYLSSGSTSKPQGQDAGTYVVQYYTPGNRNYKEKTGSVTIIIVQSYYKDNASPTSNYYLTLSEAFNSASSGSILTVIKDVEDNGAATVAKDKTLTLELDGKTITASKTGMTANFVFITNNGTLTMQDSSSGKTGMINLTGEATVTETQVMLITSSGTVTIKSGKYNIQSSSTHWVIGIAGYDDNSVINVEGGSIVATGITNKNSGVYGISVLKGTCNIKNTALIEARNTATKTEWISGIYENGEGKATINITDGTIKGNVGVFFAATGRNAGSTLNVSGANTKIEGVVNGIRNIRATGGITIDGGAISGGTAGIYQNVNNTITLNNGTITGSCGVQIIDGTFDMKGGKVTSSVNAAETTRGKLIIRNGEVAAGPTATGLVNWGNGYIEVIGGTVSGGYAGVYSSNSSSGEIRIKGGNIINNSYIANDAVTGSGIYNAGSTNIYVEGGEITAALKGIYNVGTGKVTIGTSSDNLSITSPSIQGGTYGIDITNGGQYEFYDGILKGKTAAYTVMPSKVETGYGIYDGEEGGYKVAYLKKIATIVPTPTEITLIYGDSEDIIYTCNGDGEITANVEDSNISEITLDTSAKKVGVKSHKVGETIVTISMAGTDAYLATSIEIPVTVIQKEITVIWVPEQDEYVYTYNGQIQGPDIEKQLKGAYDETVNVELKERVKDVGSYTAEAYIVDVTNGLIENYKLVNTTKAFVINRKDIAVKANANQSKGPGEAEPDLTFTYEGNIAGEIPGFTGSLTREEGEGGGRYRIRRGTLELADTDTFKAGNYNLVFIDEDTEFVISYDKEKELILVFKITDTNNKLILPIPENNLNDYMIIWGDNNSDMYTKEGFPEHIYEKAGTYTVEIGGTVKNFGYYNSLRPTDSNIYNNYLSYINQLIGIEQLGDVDAERIGFAFCENLTGDIPEANLDLSDLVSAENMFNNCVLLQGPIPINLLAGAEKVNSAKNMFLNCENLTGTIPANLFADTAEITTFESTFNNCKKLDGTIPAELFANGENVTTYAGTFKDCANLDGEIPAELFGKSTRVTTFKETFSNCTGLNTTISPRLFGTNPYVKNYYRTFYNCKGITGTIDENVFGSNVLITELPDKDLNSNYKETFKNCTGITDVRLISLVIGKEMFKDCTSIKTLKLEKTIDIGEKAFEGCNSLIQIEANNDYLRTIGIDAFEYTGTNPEKLLTKINRENELLLNYIWNDDNRLIDIEPPKGTVEIITPKDPYTNNEKVTLKITVEDNYSEPSNCKMVIMNEREYNEFANREYKDYDSLPWQDYAETVAWPLTSNDDLKTVYVLFKDEFGNANVVKDVLN